MENGTRFCPHCGNQITTDVKFCPKCGFQLKAVQSAVTSTTTEKSVPESSDQANDGFGVRLDQMMKWVTNNWATTLLMVVGVIAFTLVMRSLFGHAWLGLIALVAVLVWLESFAWTNGVAPTSVEKQLRHVTKAGVASAKASQKAYVEKSAERATERAVHAQIKQNEKQFQREAAQQSTYTQAAPNGGQNIYVQSAPVNQTNGIGTAGFVLALLSFLFDWIPGVGWIVWFLGALFSFIGLFKRPRGLAIAGFVLSFIGVIVLVVLAGATIGFLSNM